MRALENRTMDSKIEMDILEGLDEIKAIQTRNVQISPDQLIEEHQRRVEEEDAKELLEMRAEFVRPLPEKEPSDLPPTTAKHPRESTTSTPISSPSSTHSASEVRRTVVITPLTEISPSSHTAKKRPRLSVTVARKQSQATKEAPQERLPPDGKSAFKDGDHTSESCLDALLGYNESQE